MQLRETYRQQFGEGSGTVVLRLLDELFMYPALTIGRTAERLSVTRRAVQQNVDRLIAENVLTAPLNQKRNRVFIAPAIIGIIEEAGEEWAGDTV